VANKKYQVQTYVDEETKAKLDALCAKYGESLSAIARRALIKLLESERNDS
jgi:predicted transcriptional regulator